MVPHFRMRWLGPVGTRIDAFPCDGVAAHETLRSIAEGGSVHHTTAANDLVDTTSVLHSESGRKHGGIMGSDVVVWVGAAERHWAEHVLQTHGARVDLGTEEGKGCTLAVSDRQSRAVLGYAFLHFCRSVHI